MIEFLLKIKEPLYFVNLGVNYALLMGIVWSVAFPLRRIWPPPKKGSWQHRITWILFYLAFLFTGVLILLDWNSWIISPHIRFLLGIPIALIGSLLVSWGIYTLGAKNTSGIKDELITGGPYRFTRNPQYLGDMLLFIGLIFISNSLYVLITNTLLVLVFTITPIAEEVWLEEEYGEKFLHYKQNTPRFL
jgi:protein-S-isoprenylcysteine O-methyltransferase Ste14